MSVADEIWTLKTQIDKLANAASRDTAKILMIASEAMATAGSFEDGKAIKQRDDDNDSTLSLFFKD